MVRNLNKYLTFEQVEQYIIPSQKKFARALEYQPCSMHDHFHVIFIYYECTRLNSGHCWWFSDCGSISVYDAP